MQIGWPHGHTSGASPIHFAAAAHHLVGRAETHGQKRLRRSLRSDPYPKWTPKGLQREEIRCPGTRCGLAEELAPRCQANDHCQVPRHLVITLLTKQHLAQLLVSLAFPLAKTSVAPPCHLQSLLVAPCVISTLPTVGAPSPEL